MRFFVCFLDFGEFVLVLPGSLSRRAVEAFLVIHRVPEIDFPNLPVICREECKL